MQPRGHIALVTGGARSGKSALAERLCAPRAGTSYGSVHEGRIYIATAQALDDEMADRIALHRQRRDGWQTIEEPRDLVGALRRTDGQGVRLVDCLTLWLANLDARADIAGLCDCLAAQQCPVVLVTNELGLGIVPADAATRRFRDAHGWMNQAIAAIADEVWMSISGLPLQLKQERNMA